MPKVVYVWNYRTWGGAQIYFLSLMRELMKAAGHDVAAIVPEDSDRRVLEYLSELGVPVQFVETAPPAVGTSRNAIGKLVHRIRVHRAENRLITRVLAYLRDGAEPAVVHIDLGFWQSYRALSRLSRRATVFATQHTALADPGGVRGAMWRAKGKWLSRRQNFVVLASNLDAKRSLRRFLTGERYASVPVTYTGIDPDEIAAVERPSARNDVPTVMTVGQFIERKGCWTVLECLRQLRDDGENLRFLWLGTSGLDAETHEKIKGYGLGDTFRFLSAEEIGPTRADLLGLLATADIFVLASFIEGLPISLVEAMALGLPCVASNVGAIPEAIEDGASGILVPAGDVAKLTDAIRTLAADAGLRERLGAAARSVAHERFDQRRTAERTVEIYKAAAETRP